MILLNISVIAVFSFVIYRFLAIGIKRNARYFMMHVIFNTYIVYITWSDTVKFVINPLQSFDFFGHNAIKAISSVIGFHLSHILTEKLDLETMIHHITTVFITGLTAFMIPSGVLVSVICFFMCGLPGGIDYFLLVLVKYELINKITEKNINRWLNLIIRMPGMLLCDLYILINIF